MKHYIKVVYTAFEERPRIVYSDTYHTNDLDVIFRDFNAVDGSAREMTGKLKIRSLSVGDQVYVGEEVKGRLVSGCWHICDSCGWLKLPVDVQGPLTLIEVRTYLHKRRADY